MSSQLTFLFYIAFACAWHHAASKHSKIQQRRHVRLDKEGLQPELGAASAIMHVKQRPSDHVRALRPLLITPVDWFFDFGKSTSCNKDFEPAWNNTPQTFGSRVFLPLFLFIIAGCVISAGTVKVPEIQGNTVIANRPRERRYELDYARVVCISCVVVEHSGGYHWTSHNVLFVLQWVLPYLYMTSAIALMLSQKSMWGFNLRLCAVFVVGVSANWMADVVTGRDWQGDFGNTIYQMFYVVMLIAMSFIARPLRHALQYPGEPKSISHWGPTVVFGIITVVALVFFTMAQSVVDKGKANPNRTWMTQYALLLDNAPIAAIQLGGILFLCHVACFSNPNDILAWVLLAFIYIPRVLIPWEKVGFFHNFELFIFAMVAETWKIRGYKTIQKLVENYWPLVLFVFIVTSIPDIYGRCDLIPPNSSWERVRFYSIEFAFVVFISTGAFKVGDPHGALEWLNYWSLYAYCFHVCWARMLPNPYGCLLTFSSGIIFYIMHMRGSTKEVETSRKESLSP